MGKRRNNSLASIAEREGIVSGTFNKRIASGWSIEDAISAGKLGRPRKTTDFGDVAYKYQSMKLR